MQSSFLWSVFLVAIVTQVSRSYVFAGHFSRDISEGADKQSNDPKVDEEEDASSWLSRVSRGRMMRAEDKLATASVSFVGEIVGEVPRTANLGAPAKAQASIAEIDGQSEGLKWDVANLTVAQPGYGGTGGNSSWIQPTTTTLLCSIGRFVKTGACTPSCFSPWSGQSFATWTRRVVGNCNASVYAYTSYQAPCTPGPCNQTCIWGNWGNWSDCSGSCSGSWKQRFRTITQNGTGINPTTRQPYEACDPDHNVNTEICPGMSVCTIDCVWTSWEVGSPCYNDGNVAVTCGGGRQLLIRSVESGASGNGVPCNPNSASVYQECNTQPCPINCALGNWQNWLPCTSSCGNSGTMTRVRNRTEASLGGTNCPEGTAVPDPFTRLITDTPRSCGANVPANCPVDCAWNNWNPWGPCSVTCWTGSSARTRNFTAAQFGGASCTDPNSRLYGPLNQTTMCQGTGTVRNGVPLVDVAPACVQTCIYEPWTGWTPCSSSCGTNRSRINTRDLRQAGSWQYECDQHIVLTDGGPGSGCPDVACPKDCSWLPWSEWSECTATCGYTGIRSIMRSYTNATCGAGVCGSNLPCTNINASSVFSPPCNRFACSTVPGFCSWSDWSYVSYTYVTDESGVPTYYTPYARVQNLTTAGCRDYDPYAWNASQTLRSMPLSQTKMRAWQPIGSCDPVLTKTKTETIVVTDISEMVDSDGLPIWDCNHNCQLSSWSPWGMCAQSCGGGSNFSRTRSVLVPVWGTGQCPGNQLQSVECNKARCPIDCQMNPWTNVTQCSTSCGGGSQSQTRTNKNLARFGGLDCVDTTLSKSAPCNTQVCPVDCQWSGWSAWSACSQTCGTGYRVQTRNYTLPIGTGAPCNVTMAVNYTSCVINAGCPVDCSPGDWGAWTSCKGAPGLSGLQGMVRAMYQPSNGGRACNASSVLYRCCMSDYANGTTPADTCGCTGGFDSCPLYHHDGSGKCYDQIGGVLALVVNNPTGFIFDPSVVTAMKTLFGQITTEPAKYVEIQVARTPAAPTVASRANVNVYYSTQAVALNAITIQNSINTQTPDSIVNSINSILKTIYTSIGIATAPFWVTSAVSLTDFVLWAEDYIDSSANSGCTASSSPPSPAPPPPPAGSQSRAAGGSGGSQAAGGWQSSSSDSTGRRRPASGSNQPGAIQGQVAGPGNVGDGQVTGNSQAFNTGNPAESNWAPQWGDQPPAINYSAYDHVDPSTIQHTEVYGCDCSCLDSSESSWSPAGSLWPPGAAVTDPGSITVGSCSSFSSIAPLGDFYDCACIDDLATGCSNTQTPSPFNGASVIVTQTNPQSANAYLFWQGCNLTCTAKTNWCNSNPAGCAATLENVTASVPKAGESLQWNQAIITDSATGHRATCGDIVNGASGDVAGAAIKCTCLSGTPFGNCFSSNLASLASSALSQIASSWDYGQAAESLYVSVFGCPLTCTQAKVIVAPTCVHACSTQGCACLDGCNSDDASSPQFSAAVAGSSQTDAQTGSTATGESSATRGASCRRAHIDMLSFAVLFSAVVFVSRSAQ